MGASSSFWKIARTWLSVVRCLRTNRLGHCNITKCCTEICPEHIKITDNALIPLKERVVDVKFDPTFIRRRKKAGKD